MSMRRIAPVAFIAGLALAVSLPRRAEACGANGSGVPTGFVFFAVAALAGDVALTAYDLGTAFAKSPPLIGYGVLEVVVAAPQLALGISLGSGGSGGLLGYTLWMAALTTHGIWSIATGVLRPPALQRRAAGHGSRDSGVGLQAVV